MEQTTPEGKGMAVAGFVISLVALVLYIVIAGIVTVQAALGGGYGLGISWLILSLLGVGLSVMGMMKLGKTGGKKGLAITGMILGIVALILTTLLVMGIGKIQDESAKFGGKFKDAMEMGLDSISTKLDQAVDSLDNQQ